MKTILLVLALLNLGLMSPRASELTWPRAMDLALGHAYELQAAAEQVHAADKAVRAAMAERFPTLSATSMARYNSEVGHLDITLPPPINADISRDIGSNDIYQTDLTLTLPLYTGGRLSSAVASARAAWDYSEASRTAVERAVILRTRLEYLAVIQARQMVRVAEASLARSQIVAKDVGHRLEAGTADSVALIEARLGLNTAQMALNAATSQLEQARLTLMSTLGTTGEEYTINSDLPAPDSVPEMVEPTWSGRPELRQAQAGIDLAQAQWRQSSSEYLPTLAAFGGYSIGRPNVDPFSDSWNDNFTVGAQLSWSFNLGGAAQARTANRARLSQSAEWQKQKIEKDLSRELDLVSAQLELAYSNHQSALSAYRLARDNYRIATEAHKQGVLPSNRLIEIETQLTEAELRRELTIVGYHLARSRLYYANGSDKLYEGF